ncbi:MAG: beta-lactamase family protein [Firmicutes bacterium]|nr:beta-lactamase family protein [Bacillota bacterium]
MEKYFPKNKFRSNDTYLSDETIEKLDREIYLMAKDEMHIHRVYAVKDGFCIYERYYQTYSSEDLHKVYSVTKSVTSLLISILMEQGKIENLEIKLGDIIDIPHDITLRELLDMKSGLVWNEHESFKKSSGKFKRFINSASPLEYISEMEKKDGMEFNYNSLNSHLLSYVIKEVSAMMPQDFAEKYLFKPLHIESFDWDDDQEGLVFGGHGLSLRIYDMAKLGYLLLNDGMWEGKQILSMDYLDLLKNERLSTGSDYSYSLHWWIKKIGERNIPMAIGYGGQKIFVDKEERLVVAVNSMIPRKNQNSVDRIFEVLTEK